MMGRLPDSKSTGINSKVSTQRYDVLLSRCEHVSYLSHSSQTGIARQAPAFGLWQSTCPYIAVEMGITLVPTTGIINGEARARIKKMGR
jgi:hypothetical protein